MAPKNLPPAAKQQKILDYFKDTMNVYTIKELEKNLPSVASINQMQVKEYLQSLQDENLIRVEKIGSGNWYWCFNSDAKKIKEKQTNGLKSEQAKLISSIAEMEKEIEEEMAKREDDEEMLEGSLDRDGLLEAHSTLLKEIGALDKELTCYCDNDPGEVARKLDESKKLRDSAVQWTNNIECLESYFLKRFNDREAVLAAMQNACGDEYVPGEGLKDLQN